MRSTACNPRGFLGLRVNSRCGMSGITSNGHVSLFGRTPDLSDALWSKDVIYVGGGTKSMLATWRDWGLPRINRSSNQAVMLTTVTMCR
jgi:hypothetical protein